MNLLFASVLLFIIFSPGIIFRWSYFSPPFSRRTIQSTIFQDIFWAIIPGLFINFVCLALIKKYYNIEIDFKTLGFLLLPNNDSTLLQNSFDKIQVNQGNIIKYLITTIAISSILGYSLKWAVRILKLDRKFQLFRFSNKWHYLLSGEILDFPGIPDKFSNITVKGIDVLCQIGNKEIIYLGELIYYHIDSNGELDSIILRYPFRRDLDNDDNDPEKFYEIPCRFLIVPAKTILNINIRYFNIRRTLTATTS
jgi:hypothetical protein